MDIESFTEAPVMEEFDIFSDWYTDTRSSPLSSPFHLTMAGPFAIDSESESDFYDPFLDVGGEVSELGALIDVSVETLSEIDVFEFASQLAEPSIAEEVRCSGLRVVGIDSDSDSDYLESDDTNSFESDSMRNGIEEFLLEENDTDLLIEEITVASENFSDEGEEDPEWEFLLEIINSQRDVVVDFDPYMMNQDEDVYVSAVESDGTVSGQFVDAAIKGSPPASKTVVENLPLIAVTEDDLQSGGGVCAVCKDELSVGEVVKMLPCLHYYHGDCILPWLEIRNSCPVCRFELPTDDVDYERSRVQSGAEDGGSVSWDPQTLPSSGKGYVHRTYVPLNFDPLKTRLDLIHKQANDHITLVNAYAAYSRKLKLDISRHLKMFDDLARNFTDLTNKPNYRASLFEAEGALDEDVLRQFEKEVKDRVKITRLVIAESKENYDNQLKIQKLKDTVFAVNDLLVKAKKSGVFASSIAARSVPKSLHCLAMRLVGERIANPEKYKDEEPEPELEDPTLYHYVIASDNVIAVSVVVNSMVKNAEEPWKHVFHIVTDRMIVAAMKVWFKMRPIQGGAHLEVKVVEDFPFLNSSYVPILRQQLKNSLSMLNHLRFYLPEMYPKLHKILYLEDDVVVQKDLAGLWNIDMGGKVNGAVETCFGPFHRHAQYLNFSHPLIKERFNPKACAWAYGINIFDLDAWRREKCTEEYHYWQNLNEEHTLWNSGTLPPGLITFYSTTKSIDKSWHVLGLGYNPGIGMDEINNAAVIHYDGNMKPWLDIALNQYKSLWTKYVDNDMEFVQMCNFGL